MMKFLGALLLLILALGLSAEPVAAKSQKSAILKQRRAMSMIRKMDPNSICRQEQRGMVCYYQRNGSKKFMVFNLIGPKPATMNYKAYMAKYVDRINSKRSSAEAFSEFETKTLDLGSDRAPASVEAPAAAADESQKAKEAEAPEVSTQ